MKQPKLPRFILDNGVVRGWRRFGERFPLLRGTLAFVVSWVLLNALLNVRFPADDTGFDFLLPSLDLTVVFGVFALIGAVRHWGARRVAWLSRLHVPRVLLWALAVVIVFVRIYRFGDGVMEVWQSRNANVFGDLSMLEELARLLHSTLPTYQFVGVVLTTLVVLPSIVVLAYLALRTAAVYLTQPKPIGVFAGSVALAVALAPLGRQLSPDERYTGVFAASLAPRVKEDWQEYRRHRQVLAALAAQLEAATARLAQTTGDLAELQGADVLLFIVESYGEVTLREPLIARFMDRGYQRYQQTLEDNGFHAASRVLDSSVIGGFSWLAHASMLTGMRVSKQSHYMWIREQQPKTLVDYFNDAGYRTVAAEPGTTRAMPPPELYNFRERYFAPHFGYRGPKFSWAPMPDQFVIDRVHRALRQHRDPLFVKYAFVSSHAPWDTQPRLITDWSTIGDGSVYQRMAPLRFPTSWTDFSKAKWPYARSLLYTLDSIRLYIDQFVKDDTLVIIVGDHQPTTKFTNDPKSAGVVMHVLSRNAQFVDKFVARGYQPGMHPNASHPRPSLWQFPGDFIEAFSTPKPSPAN